MSILLNSGWNNFDNTIAPAWLNSFCEIIKETKLPLIKGNTLYVTTDYSGNESKSQYSVISILLADLDTSGVWDIERCIVRKNFLADGRRMSFKGLNDRQRHQALIPFLSSADKIQGLCVTVAISKEIRELVNSKKFLKLCSEAFMLQSKWKPKVFENMFRVTYFISILLAGLSKPNQNIYWISDEDEIFANPSVSSDVANILSRLTSVYVKHPLGELGIGTTKLDEGDRLEEDFAAVPDLVAGCVAELLTALKPIIQEKHIEKFLYPVPGSLSSKTELISSWLNYDKQNLKKVVLVFDKIGNKRLRIWRLRQEE